MSLGELKTFGQFYGKLWESFWRAFGKIVESFRAVIETFGSSTVTLAQFYRSFWTVFTVSFTITFEQFYGDFWVVLRDLLR